MNMKEKLESLGKNSIVLKIAKKEKYKLCATRFGGKPDVPPDFVWPTYEGESYDHVVKDEKHLLRLDGRWHHLALQSHER